MAAMVAGMDIYDAAATALARAAGTARGDTKALQKQKGPHSHAALLLFWLPDLDSNQGPAD